MKAFEEMLKKYPDVRPTSDDANWARIIWQGALRFVRKNCVLPNGMISDTLIKKELDEE